MSTTSITILHDIDFLGADREEKMDAYLPDQERYPGPRPAIVLIHGGGWRILDKRSPREVSIGNDLADAGYAVFSINYLLNVGEKDESGVMRLSRVAWPQNFYDCKSAVRFIRKESTTYRVDPQRIGVMGGSAGGHFSMLVGSTIHNEEFNREGLYTDESNEVSCILNFYGDYDLINRKSKPFPQETPEKTLEVEKLASPITWIDSNTPPMFITHGTADGIISVERSRKLAVHLENLGLDYTYVEISKAPHSYDLHPQQMDLKAIVLEFLNKYL
tara:strand:- start:29467 stop:30288 length:822 start_codon:yes stop_codon:yes gene_type:complete